VSQAKRFETTSTANGWLALIIASTSTRRSYPMSLANMPRRMSSRSTLPSMPPALRSRPGRRPVSRLATTHSIKSAAKSSPGAKSSARWLAREEGKTLPEAIGEVTRAGNIFKFFAGECLRLSGDYVPSVRPGVNVEVTREALGVVGLITPWNFPGGTFLSWKAAACACCRLHRCRKAIKPCTTCGN